MSEWYTPLRAKGLFSKTSKEPFRISRSKIDLFIECPRCFYLDRRLGVSRPPGFPFTLNSAVDHLLKKEFDAHRVAKSRHPLLERFGVDAVPYAHSDFAAWRELDFGRGGVHTLHEPTHFDVYGIVDDIWVTPGEELIVVDYKATAKDKEVKALDAEWQNGYKRQMEVYQWLLRQNGFVVSDTGYFVYANGRRDKEAFDANLEFRVELIPYTGSDEWIEPALIDMRQCLENDAVPGAAKACDYCAYRDAAGNTLKKHVLAHREKK